MSDILVNCPRIASKMNEFSKIIYLDDGPDDESHWQDRVSSGFDRLVAFASTELDKTRRSIEGAGGPSNSCNTSPDSGITHSDGRTFLSSSSSSSHLELPMIVRSSHYHHHQHVSGGLLKTTTVPIIKSSPAGGDTIEQPPRTPSPSETSDSPPIIFNHHAPPQVPVTNNLKIPLKYQRQKIPSEKHFKKKFRERNWEEYEDSYAREASSVDQESESSRHKHKTAKFRPKGKDWHWDNE